PGANGRSTCAALPSTAGIISPRRRRTRRRRRCSSFSLWTGNGPFVAALAFVLMIPWEISRRRPMIDLRILATRQYGACFLVMLATGALLVGATQFLPQLAQQNFAYTATWAGLVLSPGGVVTMVMMFVAGRLVGKIQPKYLIVAGAVIIALSL